MRIQHNIMAMGAYRNYTNNLSAMKKNLEKLSSGYKINRAGDDAAGLAISEKMRAQITGLETAQKNAKDGISLVQTAEGALTEVHDMLNRMVTLATQSANGTYDDKTDRVQLQKELDQLKEEIDRIADSSNFNGIKLLDGSLTEKSVFVSPFSGQDAALSIDGQPGAAGSKATVSFTLGTAVTPPTTPQAEVLDPSSTTEGSLATAKATKATAKLTMGGTTAVKFDVTIAGDTTNSGTNLDSFNSGATFANNDTITVNGNTYKKAAAKDEAAREFNNMTELAELMAADGITLDTATNAAAATAVLQPTMTLGGDDTNVIKANETNISDIANMKYDGDKTLGELFTVKVTRGGAAATGKIQAGDVIELEAKVTGSLGTNVENKIKAATGTGAGAGVTYTQGLDVGDGGPATRTKYDIEFTMANLAGGQKIELGGKTITITADQSQTTGSGKAVITGNATTDTDALVDAMNSTFTDFTATKTADGKITLLANNADEAANQGAIRVYDAADQDMGNNVLTYTRYAPAPVAGETEYSSVTYTVKAADLKAGAELTVGGTKITIIDESETEDPSAGKYKASTISGTPSKLAQAIENNANYKGGKITYDGTSLTITSAVKGQTADQLKAAADGGKVTFKAAPAAPAAPVVATGKIGSDTFTVTSGTTTVQDLIDKYGKTYDIVVKDGPGDNAGTRANGEAIQAGDVVTMKAKVAGKLGNNLLQFTGVSSTSSDGYDEGTSGSKVTTKYDISFDLTKLAGGQSFTFGNTSDSKQTFEISLDTGDTDNGTIGSDGTEVIPGNRTLIDLSGTDLSSAQAVADKIKDTVKNVIGDTDWNYETSVSGDTFTLKMTAKTGKDETNMGSVRYTAEGGGITGANYTPYVKSSGVTPGTYAQVGWDIDLSKLKSGDALKIGNTTVYIGAKDALQLNGAGTKAEKVTVAEGASADKIIKAFETAGYNSGRIQYNGTTKKLTITGTTAGETAADLAGAGGKVVFTPDADRVAAATTDKRLTLQIGDTAEKFNKLRVEIKDMHVDKLGQDVDAAGVLNPDNADAALTLKTIKIDNQEDAAKAVDVIKRAINQVSDVRGTLGATQNRLDHTINNLSVMTENIQDAESTIRDTDVAEEMMAYTKNNILIQSAQAMLAQANQVPQGVLQLLQ